MNNKECCKMVWGGGCKTSKGVFIYPFELFLLFGNNIRAAPLCVCD